MHKSRVKRKQHLVNYNNLIMAPIALLAALSQGCQIQTAPTAAGGSVTSPSSTATPTPTVITSGPRAVRIIFKQNYPSGSFDASPSNGTPPVPGSGQQATRFFNPDGSILAGATGTWLSSFELGISGASNTAAPNGECARFASANEAGQTANCNFGPNGPVGCGAPNGLYRISETDCLSNPSGVATQDGTGGPGDGVYVRATFNRALLGTGENLMAAFEYVASAFTPAPSNPLSCFNNTTGAPAAEQCSDVVWKSYIKHSVGEIVQPFLMLVPPTQNFANSGLATSGVNPQMRQFIIPLSGDPNLTVLQMSRIHSNLDLGTSKSVCNASDSLPADSPLCAGLVLYSLTLYRI